MGEWLAKYWWLLWAFFVVVVIVTFRMRKRGGDESTLRRAWFALFPDAAPANPHRREVTTTQLVLVGAGLLACALAVTLVRLAGS
jgi:hypothetical protein